jgi:diguanylate cyclase (GGDEF)-like protein
MPSFTLDVRTLAFVLMLISATLSFLMLYIWRTNKTYPGFGLWTLANTAGAVGFVLIGLQGVAPDFITVVLANTFTVGCLALTLKGIRKFFGLKSSSVFSIATLAVHAAILAYFTYVIPDEAIRTYTTSTLAVILGVRCTYEFLKIEKAEQLFTISFGAKAFGLFCVFMLARVVLSYIFAGGNVISTPDWLNSLTFTMFIIFVMIWTVNFIMLNSERLQRDLTDAQAEYEKLATTDFLTGICNNRSFNQISQNEVNRAARTHTALSVIMMDIDEFKTINDTYGHATGDVVLKAIAELGRNNLRGIDTIGRLGGEEFGILLPHTDLAGANTIAGHLRAAVEDAEIASQFGIIKITASFGVAQMRATDGGIEDVLVRADAKLYEAKRAGRNCVKSERDVSAANLYDAKGNNLNLVKGEKIAARLRLIS